MLVKVDDNIRIDGEVRRFTISGDPGCDGYNVEAIIVLESILGRPADFHLVLGDLVPTGRERWFRQFKDMLDRATEAPTYCLAGNHDLPDYPAHFGKLDYFIKAANVLVVILDNSRRYFSDATTDFLRQTLVAEPAEHIFVAFHIPPPNPYIPNSVSQDEWAKIRDILAPYREKVHSIFAGHVHSAFEYDLDGFHVVVTGGAGSRLDKVQNTFFAENRFHAFDIAFADGAWRMEIVPVGVAGGGADGRRPGDQALSDGLAHSYGEEALAHRRYLLYAEQALAEGYPGVAKLFRAAADSEYYHSRNMLLAAGAICSTRDNVLAAIAREEHEWKADYPEKSREAAAFANARVKNAYDCAMLAEQAHHGMLQKAASALAGGGDIPRARYFICTRCGFTHAGDHPPTICPACGTDNFRFVEVGT